MLGRIGKLLTSFTAHEIDGLFADGTVSGGMLPMISGSLEAAKSGVNAVHIIDVRMPHAGLFEILTEQAHGTRIRPPLNRGAGLPVKRALMHRRVDARPAACE